MEVWYNPKAVWLRPYFELVRHDLPKGKVRRLRSIRMVKPPAGYTRMQGHLIHEFWHDIYDIVLFTHIRRVYKPGGDWVLIKFDVIEILDCFAHELAHFKHSFHTPRHQKMTSRFMARFMTLLERQGFKSLEADRLSRWHEVQGQ